MAENFSDENFSETLAKKAPPSHRPEHDFFQSLGAHSSAATLPKSGAEVVHWGEL